LGDASRPRISEAYNSERELKLNLKDNKEEERRKKRKKKKRKKIPFKFMQ